MFFFVNKAKSDGAKNIYAFGTEALRKAKNSDTFVDLVKKLTGIDVDIISGEREAKLGLLGVLNGKDGGIIDIGGASTEIIVSSLSKIDYIKSLDVGVVSLKNQCGQDENLLSKYSQKRVIEYGQVKKTTMYGIGGTITSVASMLQSLKEYDADKINGYVIHLSRLRELKTKMFSLNEMERENIVGLQKARAGVIAGGIVWLEAIMEYLEIDSIISSENDNLEGFLIERNLYE